MTTERRDAVPNAAIGTHFSGGRRLDAWTAGLLEHAAAWEREQAWAQRGSAGGSGGDRPGDQPAVTADRGPTRGGFSARRSTLYGTTDEYRTAALGLRGVTVFSDGEPVLDDIDLRVPEGSITAVLGLTGLAKGALVETVLARRLPDRGDAYILGNLSRDLSLEERHELGLDVGIVLRETGLFSSLSLEANAGFVMRNEIGLDERQIAPRVAAALAELGLTEVAHMLPEDVSLGHRKRASFARALASEPKLILLDEPEAGFDDTRAALFTELIGHVHATRGGAYLLLTQSIPMIRALASRVILVHRGQVIAGGAARALAESPNPHVRQLLAGRPTRPRV